MVPSRKEADQVVRALKNGEDWAAATAFLDPTPAGAPDLSIAAVGQAYLRDRSRTLARSTLLLQARSLDLLNRFVGEQTTATPPAVTMMSKALLALGWEWLLDPRSGRHGRGRLPQSAKRHLETWQAFWAWVHEQDAYNPLVPRARTIELPASPGPMPCAPTFEEVDAMIHALATGQKSQAWLVRLAFLARYTGGRRTELLLLPWSAVNERTRALKIAPATTKGGYGGRMIPIHPKLGELLATWPRDTPTVVGAPPFEGVSQDGLHISRGLRRAWTRAGVSKDAWGGHPLHSLRACMRTHLAQASVHPDVIDAVMGHQGFGTGGRHYTDRARLWPRIVEAVGLVPDHHLAPVVSP
jgi:integrase